MQSRRRSQAIGWLAFAALGLLVATALILESEALKSVAVILIGCSALVLAALGKPEQTPVGLTNWLLHLLPNRLWRVVIALIGIVIIMVGAFELG